MSENKIENQVLVVDDSRVIRRAAVKILQKEFDVVEAEDGEAAWFELQKNTSISVVFSDLGMPNMDGFELLEKIRGADDPVIAKMPMIIITGAEESDGTKEEVLRLGATDFITKPFDSVTLKTRAAAHINYRNEVKALEKTASLDKLTGLLTEVSFRQQGEQALAYAKRHSTEISLVRFDIAQFSDVFVKHGKNIAEQVLVRVANIINEGKRREDVAVRLGVSRFAMLLPSTDSQGAELLVSRICQRVARLKLKLGEDVFNIRFITGITSPVLNEDNVTLVEMLSQAEKAQKLSVGEKGNGIVSYQTGKVIEKKVETSQRKEPDVEVNLEQLMTRLKDDVKQVNEAQLASAMRKILPLIDQADKKLKLGLGKVIEHLNKRL